MEYSQNFQKAFESLIGNEGGYVDHPQDPGGETNWGISKRAYPHLNIKLLTKEAAMDIYYRDFWTPLEGDNFKYSIAFEMFDAAVNHGILKSLMLVQQAVGVADDGHIGPMTRSAIRSMDQNDILLRFNAYRLKFYTKLSKWDSFGKGWVNRVADNLLLDAENN